MPFETFTKWVLIVPTVATLYFTGGGIFSMLLTTGDGWSSLILSFINATVATIIFASFTWTLSQSLFRFLKVRNSNPAMARVVFSLGVFLLIIEASMTHIGLAWITEKMSSIPPDWFLWLASFGLSLYNIFSKWGFLGNAEKKADPSILRTAVENLA